MSPHAIQRPSREPSRRGAVVVLFAFLLVLLMFSLTMAIDVGYMYVVQAELQAAADSAALAAAGEMSGADERVHGKCHECRQALCGRTRIAGNVQPSRGGRSGYRVW